MGEKPNGDDEAAAERKSSSIIAAGNETEEARSRGHEASMSAIGNIRARVASAPTEPAESMSVKSGKSNSSD